MLIHCLIQNAQVVLPIGFFSSCRCLMKGGAVDGETDTMVKKIEIFLFIISKTLLI